MQKVSWYIEFDNRTFSILTKQKIEKSLFKAAETFTNFPSPLSDDSSPSVDAEISPWVHSIASAVREISLLLYNFFYVEEKLAGNNEVIKIVFFQIYTVLYVENLYSEFFFTLSENFRVNRILACCIRLNRFLEEIYKSINAIKKSLDATFLENLDEVYIFMQQKIKETLAKTQELGGHPLNIILLDMLSLLLRNFGDSTMEKILDKTNESKIMQTIEKDNEVYQEFEENKQKELREFEKVQYFSVAQEIEEDPNLKKIEKLEDGEDD